MKVINDRLFYLRSDTGQRKIKAASYKRVQAAAAANRSAGFEVIMPGSVPGSIRYQTQHFQNAMAIVRELGKPSLFLTMTCNPKWDDIQRELLPSQHASDRPDLLARIFNIKKDLLLEDLETKGVFGEAIGICHVIEFQKRGLPHAHILLWLRKMFSTPRKIDSCISAEIPDDPHLRSLVLEHMVHNDCASEPDRAACTKDGKCKSFFPKPFSARTLLADEHGRISYRRRSPEEGGNSVTIVSRRGKSRVVTNRFVVPYNAYLLLKFNCHLNVEICADLWSPKYLFKYVYKGSAKVTAHIESIGRQVINEIQQYLDLTHVGAAEAAWHLYSFSMGKLKPSVVPLTIHLENGQRVYFQDGEEVEVAASDAPQTELTAFFNYNRKNPAGPHYLYAQMPRFFTWNAKRKMWNTRKLQLRFGTVGRVHYVSPATGDVFYLRMLLFSEFSLGKQSFDDLLCVEHRDGTQVRFENYQSVCLELGLLMDDNEWLKTLQEANLWASPRKLRSLFCTILLSNNPSDPTKLFEKLVDIFAERSWLETSIDDDVRRELVLIQFVVDLQPFKKTLEDVGLPPLNSELDAKVRRILGKNFKTLLEQSRLARAILHNGQIQEVVRERLAASSSLNSGQKALVDFILNSGETQVCAFVDAPAGTGKTFAANYIVDQRSLRNKLTVCVATSGIAAQLFNDNRGRTFHSCFNCPLTMDENMQLLVEVGSDEGNYLAACDLIIWDEAPMGHRNMLEALDRLLQQLRKNRIPFGGTSVLLLGDWRQQLPVVKNAQTNAQIIAATLQASNLWSLFTTLRLSVNMRLRPTEGVSQRKQYSLEKYAKWILQVGDGLVEVSKETGCIPLPRKLCLNGDSIDPAIEWVYGDLEANSGNASYFAQRRIFAPHHAVVNLVNQKCTELFSGELHTLCSVDSPDIDETSPDVTVEFLNMIDIPNVPPHNLLLKVGIPVVLLRNLDLSAGLCNGLVMVVEHIQQFLIICTIPSQSFRQVHIPRIHFRPDGDRRFPYRWCRRQFPLLPAFSLTISKSQGQSCKERIAIILMENCFSHGQFYVAASRTISPDLIRFCIPDFNPVDQDSSAGTVNVVFQSLLTKPNSRSAVRMPNSTAVNAAALQSDSSDTPGSDADQSAASDEDHEAPYVLPNQN